MSQPPELSIIVEYDKNKKSFLIKSYHEFSKKIITEEWSYDEFKETFISGSTVIPAYRGVKEYALYYWPELFI